MSLKIFAQLDDLPFEWYWVRDKIRLPEPGNNIYVKALATWLEPVFYRKVLVTDVDKSIKGSARYHIKTLD